MDAYWTSHIELANWAQYSYSHVNLSPTCYKLLFTFRFISDASYSDVGQKVFLVGSRMFLLFRATMTLLPNSGLLVQKDIHVYFYKKEVCTKVVLDY